MRVYEGAILYLEGADTGICGVFTVIMVYRTYLPSQLLASCVKCYWSLDSTLPASEGMRERVFPDGCMELVFHLGDLFRKHTGPGISHLQPGSFVHGQLRGVMELEATGRTSIFAVRFYPHGLQPFLAMPLHELTEQTPTLSDCWGHDGAVLFDQVMCAGAHDQRIALVESFLLKRLMHRGKAMDAAIDWCVGHITSRGGHVAIDMLASRLGISKRHLERRFQDTVGLSPKLFSRITRFQHVLRQLEHDSFGGFTQVAYATGFYDQAHFIKDFRAFTGLHPKQYFSENLALAKFFAE